MHYLHAEILVFTLHLALKGEKDPSCPLVKSGTLK